MLLYGPLAVGSCYLTRSLRVSNASLFPDHYLISVLLMGLFSASFSVSLTSFHYKFSFVLPLTKLDLIDLCSMSWLSQRILEFSDGGNWVAILQSFTWGRQQFQFPKLLFSENDTIGEVYKSSDSNWLQLLFRINVTYCKYVVKLVSAYLLNTHKSKS